MNREIRNYAYGLSATGELMIEISNMQGEDNEGNLKEAIEKFKYAQTSLSVIDPPNSVTEEHKQLVQSLGEWFSATETLNTKKNEEEFKRSSEIQKQKEKEISKITTEIGDKLVKV